MKIKRIIYWWTICLDCGYCEKIEDEYIGFNRWFCSKCNSMHLKGGFIVELAELIKEEKNV